MSGVQVSASNGWLQLRWTTNGKRNYFSLGLRDSPDNRGIADLRKQQLEIDAKLGTVDPTFKKYRHTIAGILPPLPRPSTLFDVWDGFYWYRETIVKRSTLCSYRTVGNHLKRFGSSTPINPNVFFMWLTTPGNLSTDTAARTLELTKAAYKWAVMAGLVEKNPLEKFTLSKSKPGNIADPFTKAETQAIISKAHGTDFQGIISYLFLTGCRTGEALAVQWGDVSDSQIRISRNLAKGVYLTTPKTGIRTFPLTPDLKELLQNRGKNKDLIHNVGSLRAFQNFWTLTMTSLIASEKISRYRPQYQTRHSFVTRCAENNIPPAVVAKWIGDRPSTVLNHYQGQGGNYLPPGVN
jgi:integrase